MGVIPFLTKYTHIPIHAVKSPVENCTIPLISHICYNSFIMVFLTSARAAIGSRLAVRPVSFASSYTALSAFHTFPAGQSLKESDINRDNLANVYEAEKDHQLKDEKEGKAHWKQELASNSEASVKADRNEMGDSDKDTQTLQDRTKDLPNQPKPSHGS